MGTTRVTTDRPPNWSVADFSGTDFPGALRDLVTNALRVARGSGAAKDIVQQVITCAVTLRKYDALHGTTPSPGEIRELLDVRRDYDRSTGVRPNSAVETAVSASLQIAASRLTPNGPLERRGVDRLLEAVRHGDWTEKDFEA